MVQRLRLRVMWYFDFYLQIEIKSVLRTLISALSPCSTVFWSSPFWLLFKCENFTSLSLQKPAYSPTLRFWSSVMNTGELVVFLLWKIINLCSRSSWLLITFISFILYRRLGPYLQILLFVSLSMNFGLKCNDILKGYKKYLLLTAKASNDDHFLFLKSFNLIIIGCLFGYVLIEFDLFQFKSTPVWFL